MEHLHPDDLLRQARLRAEELREEARAQRLARAVRAAGRTRGKRRLPRPLPRPRPDGVRRRLGWLLVETGLRLVR